MVGIFRVTRGVHVLSGTYEVQSPGTASEPMVPPVPLERTGGTIGSLVHDAEVSA